MSTVLNIFNCRVEAIVEGVAYVTVTDEKKRVFDTKMPVETLKKGLSRDQVGEGDCFTIETIEGDDKEVSTKYSLVPLRELTDEDQAEIERIQKEKWL